LEGGEHDAELPVLEVRLHEVLHQVDLGAEMLQLGAHHHELEDGEQVVHAPHHVARQALAHNLGNSARDGTGRDGMGVDSVGLSEVFHPNSLLHAQVGHESHVALPVEFGHALPVPVVRSLVVQGVQVKQGRVNLGQQDWVDEAGSRQY
ncbi:hypothetical protein EGW08_001063, partial [Elysia chlorotica]